MLLHPLLCLAASLVVLALLLSTTLPGQRAAPTPARSASAAEREYVAAVKNYLAECRDLAELLADVPSPREYKQRLDGALDLYARLPEAPASIDPHQVLGCTLAELRLKFAGAQSLVVERDAVGCYRLGCEQQRRAARVERTIAHWMRSAKP